MLFAKLPSSVIHLLQGLVVLAFITGILMPGSSFLPPRWTASKVDSQAKTWPHGADPVKFDTSDQFNFVLDLTAIAPAARKASFLFNLYPGGKYEHDVIPGKVVLGRDESLAVTLGDGIFYELTTGDDLNDQLALIPLNSTAIAPLSHYPFDEYEVTLSIRALLIRPTSDARKIVAAFEGQPPETFGDTTNAEMSLTYFDGLAGWTTRSSFDHFLDKNGKSAPGCQVKMKMIRSPSVKIVSCSSYVIMWLMSLSLLAIALHYSLSTALEAAYDVPALMLLSLPAIPMIRNIPPDIPYFINLDLFGLYLNMAIVSASTLMVMAALARRLSSRTMISVNELTQPLKTRCYSV